MPVCLSIHSTDQSALCKLLTVADDLKTKLKIDCNTKCTGMNMAEITDEISMFIDFMFLMLPNLVTMYRSHYINVALT